MLPAAAAAAGSGRMAVKQLKTISSTTALAEQATPVPPSFSKAITSPPPTRLSKATTIPSSSRSKRPVPAKAKKKRYTNSTIKRQKYFICKGNNSILIVRSFRTRSGWSPAKVPEDADFIWSQYSRKALFDLGHSRSKPRTLNHLCNN
jgi:hypothetical protein